MKVDNAPYNWAGGKHPGVMVKATLTQTAGLCIAHSRRLKVNNKNKTTEVIELRSWDIVTYPSGYAVLQGIKTKSDAISIAEQELNKFSWVCLFYADFEKNNDMKAVRKKIMDIRSSWSLK
jgi:mRNA deadenylase 3'-5' endonuclease subunit Ccr4